MMRVALLNKSCQLASVARSGAFAKAAPRLAMVSQKNDLHSSRQLQAAEKSAGGMLASSHWKAERVISVALLGLIPAAIATPCTALDMSVAVLLPLHNHWGTEQVILDYVHGANTFALANILLKAVSAGTVAGLVYFNLNDVGLGKAVRQIWSL
eukprot:Colp12_sorted_trinity150504_noHs@19711